MKREKINGFHNGKETLFSILCLVLGIFVWSCSSESKVRPEPWVTNAISEWPDFVLTNEISFADTVLKDVVNSFLIDTCEDTLAVSTKHLFMVFDGRFGIHSIDMGDQFNYWKMYPKNRPDKVITTARMINTNPNEPIGEFNTLKSRDWILFDLQDMRDDLYPLKIRYEPVKKDEIVYAVGWSAGESDNNEPVIIELQCFQPMGNYFYTQTITPNVDPRGRSGSAVIDQNGYLVGIVSGAEGNLGVIGSVDYLREIFNQYGVLYQTSYPVK
ncbi:MAG: hypothetical protein R3220_12085 [Balneolaceae bacterium]|nr:hypothetical protein [Balneolaceae bacterium]